MIRGHVEWEKAFDAAIAKGRGINSETGPDRATAIAELKALGITESDAIRAIEGRK
jgi:hypothetical protein